jgi:hypothetical protein
MSRRDELLPRDLRAGVVSALYADADRMGWRTLGLPDRSHAYSAWVDDPRIGGVLTGFMTPEQARAWIKDGPMKEYGRALRGAGRYAAHGRQGGTGPNDVVRHALGPAARLVEGSVGSKPLHCLAEVGDETAYLVWGDSSNFRNLLWAALRVSVDDGLEAHIVVMEPPGATTRGEEAKRQRAYTDRCRLHLHHMREILGMPGGGP